MARGDDKVGEAFVEIRASLDKLEKDFKKGEQVTRKGTRRLSQVMSRASQSIMAVGGVAKTAALAIVGVGVAIEALSRQTRDQLDQLDKLSTRLGVTTGFLQETEFAASQSGVAMNTLTMAMQRFTRRAAEAKEGTGEAKDAIKELGIQLTDSQGRMRRTEELFSDAMRALARIDDPARRLRLAFKLFDSEGASLVQLADNFEDLTEKARQSGLVVEESVIKKAVDSKDQLDVLWKMIKAQLATAFVDFSQVALSAASALATVAHHAGIAWSRLKDLFNLDPTTIAETRDRLEELDTVIARMEANANRGRAKSRFERKRQLEAAKAERDVLLEQLAALEEASEIPPPPQLDALQIRAATEELDRQHQKFEEFTAEIREQTDRISEFWDDLTDDFSRGLAEMVASGEISFRELGEAFVREFTERALRSLLFTPILQALGAGISAIGGALFGGASTQYGPFEGGLVTPFSDATGQFQIPELNPGFRAPLPESGGIALPAVAVYNNAPAQVATAVALDGSVDVYISEAASRSVSSGGPLAGALQDRYSLSPRALR